MVESSAIASASGLAHSNEGAGYTRGEMISMLLKGARVHYLVDATHIQASQLQVQCQFHLKGITNYSIKILLKEKMLENHIKVN